ncbi:low molecular weight protein-tyrosine-phosphatase [Volucribacter amazonae]|uniref:protein-tyrosine-phosphatase n=1 Tax=Volucribacter amazonae TaxID=256731 RepID=A0A9X4PAD6_9PAST|nr:low molecular weight phosphotyrosine protein phosphatase [Volucribacter amazonae]MDG6895443.1 protein-tyrosine-phosphatase [Volucribacter amazonae]
MQQIGVLFVCLGNICRSPMAEYVMRDKLKKAKLDKWVVVDSAGTAGYHDGEDMHRGTAKILRQYHIDKQGFVSRKIRSQDWQQFDYIIAMDNSNLSDLQRFFQPDKQRLFKITDLCPTLGYDHIPDPWYTGDFQQTYDLLNQCCDALLVKLQQQLGKK